MTSQHMMIVTRLCDEGKFYEAMEEACRVWHGEKAEREYVMMRYTEHLFAEVAAIVDKNGA